MLRDFRNVLIGLVVLAAAPASGREACQERTLSLRYAPQASTNWCWAASGEMTMEWLGSEPNRVCQCRQAEQVLVPANGVPPGPRRPGLPLRHAGGARGAAAAGAQRIGEPRRGGEVPVRAQYPVDP